METHPNTLFSPRCRWVRKNTGSLAQIAEAGEVNMPPISWAGFDITWLPQLREEQAREEMISAQLQPFTILQINTLRNRLLSETSDHLLCKTRTEIPRSVLLEWDWVNKKVTGKIHHQKLRLAVTLPVTQPLPGILHFNYACSVLQYSEMKDKHMECHAHPQKGQIKR